MNTVFRLPRFSPTRVNRWLLLLCAWALELNAAPAYLDDAAAGSELARNIADRLSLMPAVSAVKWKQGTPLVDAGREQAVLEQVARRATQIGLSDVPVRGFFSTQIRLARSVQRNLHDDWARRGCAICDSAPSLAESRARLDAIDRQQLRLLYLAAPALSAPSFPADAEVELRHRLGNAGISSSDIDQLVTSLREVRRAGPPGLRRIRTSGVLRVATTGDYDPFTVWEHGQLRGSDIERAIALAQYLKAEPVFVKTTWPTLLADLTADRFDVAISGISVTPERSAVGLFSTAYHTGGKTILARCAERQRFATLAALNQPGVRVIVNPGGSNERFLRERVQAERIHLFPDNRAIFTEIIEHRADAMITDDIEADLQARLHPELCRTLPGTLNQVDKAIFMVKDPPLQAVVDAWLVTLRAAH